MKTFWKNLPKPIYALAPMEGVTDTVFRKIINYCGKPSVYFTEFTNVDGLFSKGKKQVEHRLIFEKDEKPLIAQIWGMNPENYTKAAQMIADMGFDGIDINMGCPERNVVKRGACAGLIHNRVLAKEIIEATKKGAENLPVSVKTRIGILGIETEEWISFLLNQNLDALTVHSRTVKEMSAVPAHWDEMLLVSKLRDTLSPSTIVLGNGDVESVEDANEKVKKYKLDGVMIGRGIFKDPYLFNNKKDLTSTSFDERMDLLLKHAHLFETTWGKSKHYPILKKFFKIYTLGLHNASEIREKLMETNNFEETKQVVDKIRKTSLL